MLNENKKDKWIEVVTKINGRLYTTTIRCSDISAIQYHELPSRHMFNEELLNHEVDVDIHVSSDTIFTTSIKIADARKLRDKITGITGDEEE